MAETYTSGVWSVKAGWESFEAPQAWKDDPEFRDRIMRVRSHCEDFQPSVLELVVAVD
jgi:heme-degrading monooxygenase HmoA